MKKIKLIFAAMIILAGTFASAQEAHFRKGKYSEVDLQFVTKCNTIVRENGTKEVYPDGFVFYFVIYPLDKNSKQPALQELRDFLVDNKKYSDLTVANYGKAVEPRTVMYDTIDIFENEPDLKGHLILDPDRYGMIMKTIICGTKIPSGSTISFDLVFGWDKKAEKFSYSSKVQ